MRRQTRRPTRSAGFTLLELLIVILIIGIVLSLVLVAANDGVRLAEVRATQALITKLDVAINDRLESLLASNVDILRSHHYMAKTIDPNTGQPFGPLSVSSDHRAQTIARINYIHDEMPDVFFVQANPAYPLNFAGMPYPGTAAGVTQFDPFVLPIGFHIFDSPPNGTFGCVPPAGVPIPIGGTGIFGASYAATAGLAKELGAQPAGYDGNDSNGDNLVDDAGEWGPTARVQNLQVHTHKTARAEMLYALLVNGRSPLGSPFRPDDFSEREVQDTDGDGLPEFVDAWGEPLQFYRWPIYFASDIQQGYYAYPPLVQSGNIPFSDVQPWRPRQKFSLDGSQQLMAPGWWSDLTNPQIPGPNAIAFMNFFTSLVESGYPLDKAGFAGSGWDRGGFYQRRSYFCRPLIISSGPDKTIGLAQLTDAQIRANPPQTTASYIIAVENQASPYPNRNGPFLQTPAPDPGLQDRLDAALDDVANQTFKAPGGAH